MIDNWPILSIVTFLPLAGVLFLLLIKGDEKALAQNSRFVAMWVSGFTFLVSLPLLIGFDSSVTGYQFEEKAVWLAGTGIGYHMGVDGISMPFVLLSTLLTPLSILASWRAITHRVREYMIAFLVLETMMVGMFVSLDMLMFYLFFEAVLIPMFLIIGIWGGPRRVYAAFKFFLYTLLGSVLMLVCMLAMYVDAGTTDIPALDRASICRVNADMAVPWLPRVIRGKGANVACAYMASRCACRGTNRRINDSGGRFVENGRLWIFALFIADVPAGV